MLQFVLEALKMSANHSCQNRPKRNVMLLNSIASEVTERLLISVEFKLD